MSSAKRSGKPGGGRSDFLNATVNAAIGERIRKEERTLHKLLQAQLESGRIKLPSDGDEAAAGSPAKKVAASEPNPEAVARNVEWLLAARKGTGGGAAAASPAAAAGTAAAEEEGEEEADAEAIDAQLRAINRSLSSTLAGGAASGTCAYSTSSARDDYRFNAAAVAAMKAGGELEATHHRRRDAQTAHNEAAAREAGLRRAAPAAPK